MRLPFVFSVLALAVTAVADEQCYHIADYQGCNPDGYPYEFNDCPSTCSLARSSRDYCDAPDPNNPGTYRTVGTFESKGDDWDFNNMVYPGFKYGHISYPAYHFQPDRYNECTVYGECKCLGEFEPGTLNLVCHSVTQGRWEEYTLKLSTWECESDGEYYPPPDDSGADEYYDDSSQN